MRTKDISFYITSFFSHYLVSQRNVSENTVKAYREMRMSICFTFGISLGMSIFLLLRYMQGLMLKKSVKY